MASQVLSGSSNVSYTNNTGQNVRIVINYMSGPSNFIVNWAGVSVSSFPSSGISAIGRNLAFSVNTGSSATITNTNGVNGNFGTTFTLPTELMLAPGQTFSASTSTGTITAYNIVVIPEAG